MIRWRRLPISLFSRWPFLSGTFYSVDRLPAPFDLIASVNPVFMAIDGFRYAMIGISDRPFVTSMIVLLVLNGVLSVLCYHLLGTRLAAEKLIQPTSEESGEQA